MAYFEFIKHIDHLLESEGWSKVTNDQDDKGGLTKFGISQRAFPDIDIKGLTVEKAKALYFKEYWVKGRCGDLPKYLQYIHFDSCVNHGPGTAARLLQKGIGEEYVKIDGDFGQKTFENSYRCSLADYVAQRALYYAKIVKSDPTQIKFLVGWNNRLVNVAKVKI